jgi:hypothetical protein
VLGIAMQWAIPFFADNQTVVAIANFGGLVGLLSLAFVLARAAVRFSRTAYHTSVKTALARSRRSFILSAAVASLDPIEFQVQIWTRFLLINLIGFVSVTSLVGTIRDPIAIGLSLHAPSVRIGRLNDIFSMVVHSAYLIAIGVLTLRAVLFVRLVGRWRRRFRSMQLRQKKRLRGRS